MKAQLKHIMPVVFILSLAACGGGNQDEAGQAGNTAPATVAPATAGSATEPMGNEMSAMDGSNAGMTGGSGMQDTDMGAMGSMDMNAIQQNNMPTVAEDDLEEPRLTEQGLFRVTVRPAIAPLPINLMHGWVIHIETASGENVDDAEITLSGGMPAHNHGMPTTPQVTADMGNGDYQIEGIQFQMPGHWVVGFTIAAGGQEDTVSYNLKLQP